MNVHKRQIAEAALERAKILMIENNLDAGIATLKYALSILPDFSDAKFHLAKVYFRFGDYATAKGYIQDALKDDPKNHLYIELAEDISRHPTCAITATQDRPSHSKSPQKLLITIDYTSQPYNIGDLIIYQHVALALAKDFSLTQIDFCFISDPNRPPIDENITRLISSENRFLHLFSIAPIVQLNPLLGSIFICGSWLEYERLVHNGYEHYIFWPSLEEVINNEYMFYKAFHLLAAQHKNSGELPQLRFCNELEAWCQTFFHKFIYPQTPITVNIRNNHCFHHHRNSDLDVWREFFISCSENYAVKFIVTCSLSEIDERLLGLPNVVIAKEHHTNILQDLALIQFSAFHLGASSGPVALAMFKSAPYYVAHCDMLPYIDQYDGSLRLHPDGYLRFSFAGELQRFGIEKETPELLLREFQRIWNHQDWSAWTRNVASSQLPETHFVTWL